MLDGLISSGLLQHVLLTCGLEELRCLERTCQSLRALLISPAAGPVWRQALPHLCPSPGPGQEPSNARHIADRLGQGLHALRHGHARQRYALLQGWSPDGSRPAG